MGEQKSSFYWHVHHDRLLEHCYDYGERLRYILKHKPENERELRLRLFQPVRGELPARVMGARSALDEACCALDEAARACVEASRTQDRIWSEAMCNYDQVLCDCDDEICVLHAAECPDCPWNGVTIFSGVEK